MQNTPDPHGPLTPVERSGLQEIAKIAVYRTLAAHLGMSVQHLKDAEARAFDAAVDAYWPEGARSAQRRADARARSMLIERVRSGSAYFPDGEEDRIDAEEERRLPTDFSEVPG